jgi:4-amino-4-deoxy-L-arabinose transferase-like glycosyltransferase
MAHSAAPCERPSAASFPVASTQTRWLLAGLLAWAFGVRLWYASTGLDEGRFTDESYILDNVASFLTHGSLHPVHLYYPELGNLLHSLLLGAADALARWSGRGNQTILQDRSFTPAAYFLSRSFQACIGVLTIYWTYRLGRRFLSPRVGLLAALALAAVPVHVRLSIVIKPDILMLLGLLITVEATAAALASGRLRYFLGAGAAVGLATAGKYNGVAAAVPIAVLALPGVRREPAILARLAAAGAASLLVFALIDPFFFTMQEKFQRNFGRTLEHYKDLAGDAGEAEASHLEALRDAPAIMLSPNFHGVVTGVLGLAGLAVTFIWAWRRRDRCLALLTISPLAYLSLYAVMTNHPKNNNYLPLCPFIALGAAALAGEAWRRHGRAAPAFAAVTLLWCATLVWRPMAYTYREIVPTTLAEAEQTLLAKLAPLANSRVLYQLGATDDELQLPDYRDHELLLEPEPGDRADLDLADAEIFTSDALANRIMAGRLASASQVVRIVPRPFRVQGEPLSLVLHPWAPAGDPIELEALPSGRAGTCTVRLPAGLAFPLVVSFELILPRRTAAPDAVIVGTHRLDLLPAGRHNKRWLTERLRLADVPGEIAITDLPANVEPQSVRLFLWAKPL